MSQPINPGRYKNKVILLGTTTQFSQRMPTVIMTAYTVASLLNQDFFITPLWLWIAQIILFIMILIYVSLMLPRLSTHIAVLVNGTLLCSLWLLAFGLLQYHFLIVEVLPMLLILLAHSSLLLKRSILAYQNLSRSRPSAIESNRLLGLAFQGQGQLDMAFEKFRLCPANQAILSLLYNLALDYELKCNYAGATMVYRYILTHHNFRDVEQRLERLRTLKKSQLNHNVDDWLLDGISEKPRLGRYQIERQLGKGAMGVVYLGKDSKLDRLVAIKTLALSKEFELEGLAEATARFFREANAAGRLQHPDIISIYDAGEQYNLAYIAMEFFKGGNLIPYTKSDNLLPITTVLDIGIRVAEALDYAQKQGVIHRDIKPANIMYNPATEQVKITDFGIAYITDANKTKTGVVLGTPSYMSPEQFAGKLLDGCSDLFSLSVTLFQLLTGQLPFPSTSMANLMYKITHEPPLDILRLRHEISPRLKQVMEQALEKDPRKRFQQGIEFAQALRDCRHEI
ncbi:MAG: serine/threonine-protein kinase [Thiotrichaceae bacterium]